MPYDKKRLDWIDFAKGVGITCVVAGHIFTEGFGHNTIYLFHMPLFFFIGGYLLRPTNDYRGFLKRKTQHLLVPYFAFCIVLTFVQYLRTDHAPLGVMIERFILGGIKLSDTGWMEPYWFITCFFITQQLFNILATKCRERTIIVIMALSLAAAYVNEFLFPKIFFPWSANNVFYALPIFYSGYLYRKYVEDKLHISTILIAVLVAAAIVGVYIWPSMHPGIFINRYGWPVVTFAIGLVMIHALILVSKSLCDRFPILSKPVRYTGTASMVVLCLHPFFFFITEFLAFKFTLPALAGSWVKLLFALCMSVAAYWIFGRFRITRHIFLGQPR